MSGVIKPKYYPDGRVWARKKIFDRRGPSPLLVAQEGEEVFIRGYVRCRYLVRGPSGATAWTDSVHLTEYARREGE